MHFGFALELSDIDLWNIDLLDTHSDLLDTDIPSKCFVCLHGVIKTSSRKVFKTYSRHVFKTSPNMSSRRLQDMSSRRLQDMSSRLLQHNNFSPSKMSWKRLARCLQHVLEDVKLLRWRLVENFFKTSSRPTNVCWVPRGFFIWKFNIKVVRNKLLRLGFDLSLLRYIPFGFQRWNCNLPWFNWNCQK